MTRSTSTRRDALRRIGAVGSVAIGFAVAGCTSGGDDDSAATVAMTESLAFEPSSVSIEPGESIRWENESEVAHTVTAYGDEIPENAEYFASGAFGSEPEARAAYPPGGSIEPGNGYEQSFDAPGEYRYFCIPHEASDMIGSISVFE